MSELILGVSAYYHDSAAALVSDGLPVAAAQEERFTRRRHDAAFPAKAIKYCLDEAGAKLDDVAAVVYYENPKLKVGRVRATYLTAAPFGSNSFAASVGGWLGDKRSVGATLRRELKALDLGEVPPVQCRQHHESHAASAFLPSPYETAAVLCVDGVGEWATTTMWHGRADGSLEPLTEIRFPHSLGLLYSAFTYFCGFKVDSGEYKLMGLAPYGTPRFADVIRRELIDIKPDGSFHLNMRYFEYLKGEVMTGRAMEGLFGIRRRLPEAQLTVEQFDLAASIQQVTEEVVLKLGRTARRLTGESRLCLAGGVALNCVANGKLAEAGVFDELWIQPAAGDAGGALGAAMLTAIERGARRPLDPAGRDAMSGSLLGPSYSDEHIASFLTSRGIPFQRYEDGELATRTAELLAQDKVVGWFQGRMEFGPRALGARSILGDARSPEMQSTMNLKIKFRESFRPFAPAVLAERAGEYFGLTQSSPYMLLVAGVQQRHRIAESGVVANGLDRLKQHRSTVPAVTHVDYSARVQTVEDDGVNPPFYRLLSEFDRITGSPVLVNTSFNVRGEPIVNTPEDAYTCFMRTNIDYLVLGNHLLAKQDQPQWSEESGWRESLPLD